MMCLSDVIFKPRTLHTAGLLSEDSYNGVRSNSLSALNALHTTRYRGAIILPLAPGNPYLSAEPAAILLPSGDQEHLRRFYKDE